MAQSIILKRSALQGKVPTTSSLNVGELAINTYDGKIYLNRSGSSQSIQEIVTTNAVNTGSITLTRTGSFGELVVSQDGNFQRDLYVTRDIISNGNLDVLYDVTASAFLGVIRATNGVISSSAQLTSLNSFTASAALRLTNLETTTSSLNSSVSQINLVTASLNSKTASYATTGSNTFIGNQRVSGSITTSGSVLIIGSGSNVFSVDGTSGRLFSVDDSLSGSLFSVNTIAGLPVIEAFSDNTIRIGQFGQRALFVSQSRVGIGKELGLSATLEVSGSAIISGSLIVTQGITGSLFGTASFAQNALTTSYANSGFRIANSEFHNTSSLTTSGTTTISQLATGSYISAFYNYSIISGPNARAGQIMSIWSGSTATYTEVTTTDIGNTSAASFAVNVVGSNIQLNFTAIGTWTVRTIANLL